MKLQAGLLGLLATCLAGCAALAGEAARLDFHPRPAVVPVPPVQRAEWARHLVRMQLGLFPEAGRLPEDHVLPRDAALAGVRAAEASAVAVTWIGHSTALIRMGGKWILTDPVMMPAIGVGPLMIARLAPPRPALDDLPPIDVILISHGDHDHLDLRTLRRLAVRNPDVLVLVPAGNARLLAPIHLRNVIEMDWYQRGNWQGLGFEAVPAIHGLRRPPEPADSALWGGWIVRAGHISLYFAGDTGFGPLFGEIRRQSGPVDFALVPIGAYAPRRLEAPFHVAPEEAAAIARVLGARTAIGVHWGTFPLSEEAPIEQQSRFLAASARTLTTLAPRIGETIILVDKAVPRFDRPGELR